MPDVRPPTPEPTIAEALSALPLETPDRSGWPLLAERIAAKQPAAPHGTRRHGWLIAAALAAAIGVLGVWLTVPDGHSPDLGRLLLMLILSLLALIVGLLGLRFAWVAIATLRSRVEISDEGLRVVGVVGSRDVPWDRILAIESRVVHPVHWLTAALRLRDGSRVLMPAFDQHIWAYSRPSGEDIRALRRELHERDPARRPRL